MMQLLTKYRMEKMKQILKNEFNFGYITVVWKRQDGEVTYINI